MLLGVDTGFFISYANNHPRALQVWQEFVAGRHTLVVSTLSLSEILVYFYKRSGDDMGQEWVNLIVGTDGIEVVPVSVEIAVRAARYRHGLGLPTVDSLILATCLERGCEAMLSTDSDFRIVAERKVLPVEFLL